MMEAQIGSPKKNRGQTLLGVLVTLGVMAIAMMSFLSMFKSQSKAARNLAGRGGIVDLSHALDALFGSPQCATAGTYLSAGSPAIVSVTGPAYSLSIDTISFANGSPAISALANSTISQMIQPYSILSKISTPPGINLIALGGGGPNGTGFKYPFQMQVTFESSNGPPPRPLNKFITVYTDSSGLVQGACYLAGNSSSKPALKAVSRKTPLAGQWIGYWAFGSTANCLGGELALSGSVTTSAIMGISGPSVSKAGNGFSCTVASSYNPPCSNGLPGSSGCDDFCEVQCLSID